MRYLIRLTASPTLEEALIDWLARFESPYGFSSFPLSGHSSRMDGMSLAEQVSGRKKRVAFEIDVAEAELASFLDRLRQDFNGSGIHFQVLPVSESGDI